MAASRNPNYTIDEDKHLCHVYMEISQDPETGIYQKKDQFWNLVTEAYNSVKPNPVMSDRSKRSIDSRMQTILSAISKFKGCVLQVEYLNLSGASKQEQDIITRAKQVMALDPKFSKDFKFEHVWDIMKDFVKFDCTSQKPRAERCLLQSDTTVPESPISPDGLSSFFLNLSDSSGSASRSQRPDGLKKSKLKRKKGENVPVVVNSIREVNQKIQELFENSTANRERDMHVQLRKIEAQNKAAEAKNRIAEETRRMAEEYRRMTEATRWEADNKILMIDTDSISNPARRLYFEQEQTRILSKRQEQLNQSTPPNNTFDFGSYFPDIGGSASVPDIGGSGSDFGDYYPK